MPGPNPASAVEAIPAGSSWSRVWGALAAPAETFSQLASRPTWAVGLVALLVVGLVFGWFAMGRITPEELLRSLEAQGRTVPQEMRDDPERVLASMRGIQVGAGTLFAALFYLAAAGIFLVLFRLLGSDLTYRQSLATTVHGLLPLGVAALIGIVVVLGREQVTLDELQGGGLVASNLGFLAGDEAGKVTRALLSSLDLFSAWSAWLLAVGYRQVARVSAGAAGTVVGTLWAVGIGLKALLASIF